MTYDFDTVINRVDTQSVKWDKYSGQDVIPMWVADMDFAMAPEISAALAARLAHPVLGYSSASVQLVEALQSHLQSVYQWKIDPEWLVWMPGVVAGLAVSVRAYAQPASDATAGGPGTVKPRIITNPPIYHHFFRVHDEARHELVTVPLKRIQRRWTYDLDAMAEQVCENTRLIMLCSPHNPTGTVFTREELRRVCELADKVGAVVVSDEIHCGLVHADGVQHVPTQLCADEFGMPVVTLMSVSKTFNLAGLNLSYAIIPDASLRDRFRAASAEIISPVGPLAYTAAEAALVHGEPWRQQLLAYIRDNQQYLLEQLADIRGMELHPVEATYLAWIDATALGLNDTTAFFERHGVGFSSGEQFGQPQYLRMNLACPRATLENALTRIRAAVATL